MSAPEEQDVIRDNLSELKHLTFLLESLLLERCFMFPDVVFPHEQVFCTSNYSTYYIDPVLTYSVQPIYGSGSFMAVVTNVEALQGVKENFWEDV